MLEDRRARHRRSRRARRAATAVSARWHRVTAVSLSRKCSRTACPHGAVATLTYVYADSTAVLGPLATYAEPHTYDLCGDHAGRLTPPRGWDIVRLESDYGPPPTSHDDLVAIAEAVRESRPRPGASRSERGQEAVTGQRSESGGRAPHDDAQPGARRGHLRVLR